MRVEFVDETQDQNPTHVFPKNENHLDLRKNPRAVERIVAARKYLPLRNFLTAMNSAKSIFTTASAVTKSDLAAAVSAGEGYEFASETNLVFAEPSLNFEREPFADLRSGLKELLDKDSADAVRVVLLICSCDFPIQNRRGFCLAIRLVAQGDSAEQAELRWGLGLARVQQALLFRARSLKQRVDE